jgi:hypothetical protein
MVVTMAGSHLHQLRNAVCVCVYIAYDKDSDRISGAFRTYKDAQGADPKLAHQLRYPRLN